MPEPALDVLASWLQDRYTEADEISRAAWPWATGSRYEGQPRDYRMFMSSYGHPRSVMDDVASKRALLTDLMAEGHEHWCPQCPPALSPDEDCICELGARLLRRLRILASPFTGRADMPAELREETRG